jgi:hypothetical protein
MAVFTTRAQAVLAVLSTDINAIRYHSGRESRVAEIRSRQLNPIAAGDHNTAAQHILDSPARSWSRWSALTSRLGERTAQPQYRRSALDEPLHSDEPRVRGDLAEPAGSLHGPVIWVGQVEGGIRSQVRAARPGGTGYRL